MALPAAGTAAPAEAAVIARPFGLHGPNYPGLNTDDLDQWQRINPGLVVVCQPDFPLIPEIRQRIPGVVIVGRIFGEYAQGWDAWHLPWDDHDRMFAYGRYVAAQANQWRPDIIQYANEPGIDDGDPKWFTVAGYQRLARGCGWVVDGYRSAGGGAQLGTVPLSPGHEEDDGLLGAQYLKDVWHRHDVLLLHTYWNRDPDSVESEWYGRRYRRQLAAYAWSGPWAITEWNRDETGQFGDAERIRFAEDARMWIAGLPSDGSLLGTAEYIWFSGDEARFGKLRMRENRWLIDVAAEVNAASTKEEPVNLPIPSMPEAGSVVVRSAPPTMYAGHLWVFEADASGYESSVLTLLGHLPLKPDKNAYWQDFVLFDDLSDGRLYIPFQVPNILDLPDEGIEVDWQIDLLYSPDGKKELRHRAANVVATLYPARLAGAAEVAALPAPVHTPASEVFYNAGTAFDRSGDERYRDIQRVINRINGGPDEDKYDTPGSLDTIFYSAGEGFNQSIPPGGSEADGDQRWLEIHNIVDAIKTGKPLPQGTFLIPAAVYDPLVRLTQQYGTDIAIDAAQIEKESGFNPDAEGDPDAETGAPHSIGLLQLHDMGMGAGMSVAERKDPATNLEVGLRAQASYLAEFGSIEAALTAHNAGGPAVRLAIKQLGPDGWQRVVHHREDDGTVVLVKDIYTLPILRRANEIRSMGIKRGA